MKIPYLAHIPFVLLFLVFTVCFLWAHRARGRQERKEMVHERC